MKKQLLILLTFFTVLIGYSQTFTENFITYQVLTNTSNVIITNYDPSGGTVVDIPATVTNNSNTYNITIINTTAFASKGLTNVTIPDSVLIIGDLAFTTNQLTSIIIPVNVTSIGSYAFQYNPLVTITSLATTPPAIITGSAGDSFNANRSNIQLHIPAGTMGVYVTNAGALWTGFNPVTEDALGTSNFELENEIKVITTSNTIELSYSNNVRLENYEIYNMTGAKVKEGNQNNTIAIDEIANGIYILKLNFDNGTVVRKVLIE